MLRLALETWNETILIKHGDWGRRSKKNKLLSKNGSDLKRHRTVDRQLSLSEGWKLRSDEPDKRSSAAAGQYNHTDGFFPCVMGFHHIFHWQ